MNPFDDTFDDTSAIVYSYIPMGILGLSLLTMLYQKATNKYVNIVQLLSTLGLFVGMVSFHMVDMYIEEDKKDMKQSGFYGYIGMAVGLIISLSLMAGKRAGTGIRR